MKAIKSAAAVPQKSKCVLVVDLARESRVTVHATSFAATTIKETRITVGDYAIVTPNNEYLAIIERKSLEDYAASIKDGRIQNTQKLIDLRSKTGCKIVYIVEGPRTAPDEYIGRTKMTYKMIESNMFHQIVRDGICVLRTADTLDTANTLARFVASMDTLIVKTDVVEITAPLPDKFEQAPPDLELLKVNHVKTDHEVACEMWSSFKGITATTADEYMRVWSIGDIVCGEISRADIEGFRTSGGKKISKNAANSLTGVTKSVEIRILSKIPGVSQATASQLMTANSLRQIAKFSVGALSIQKIGASKKNLGEVRAKKILDMLWYRPQVAQPAPAARIDDAELAEMISTIGI